MVMTPRLNDARKRPSHTPRMSVSSPRAPTTDVRKRMDDVYGEMQRSASEGQLRLPTKFVGFHETDVMFQFTRAVVGYALAYVKVKTLEKDYADFVHTEELAKFHASQSQHLFLGSESHTALLAANQQSDRDAGQQRLQHAVEQQKNCTKVLGETYARLVLHCSNFEHHKEDERFFECVFFFVCSVAKVGLAPEYWDPVEDELGYFFRGAQFSATIKQHSTAKAQRLQTSAAAAAAAATNEAAKSAAKKIQNLSTAASGSSTKDAKDSLHGHDTPPFELPPKAASRCCYFSASLPVGKIISELDAVKLRATRNIEISQSIREELQQRRLAAKSPRAAHASTSDTTMPPLLLMPQSSTPQRRLVASGSPRLPMKATFTSRSPAVNHFLPGTEDRVRLVLETYEKELQRKLAETQKSPRQPLSPTARSEPSTTSTVSLPLPTPTKPGRFHRFQQSQ